MATPSFKSDEGVTVQAIDHEHLINLTDANADRINARRTALHVRQRTYQHVSENAAGQWVYRNDR